MYKIFAYAAIACAMTCLVIADDQVETSASEAAAATADTQKEIKNGLGYKVLDLALIAGKNAKEASVKGLNQATPTINSINQQVGSGFGKLVKHVKENPTLGKVAANENVKKGFGFLKNSYENRVKPAMGYASEKIKPIVNSSYNKAKPHLDKVNQKFKESSDKIMADHEARMKMMEPSSDKVQDAGVEEQQNMQQ